MKRDFRAPKNKGIFEAKMSAKKYPCLKVAKSQVRQGFLRHKNGQNYAGESSLRRVIPSIRRGRK